MAVELTVDEMIHLMKKFSYSDQIRIMISADKFVHFAMRSVFISGPDEATAEIDNAIHKQSRALSVIRDPLANMAGLAISYMENTHFIGWLWRFIINEHLDGADVPGLHIELAKCMRDGYLHPIRAKELAAAFPDPHDWMVGSYLNIYLDTEDHGFPNEAELLAFEPGPSHFTGEVSEIVRADWRRRGTAPAPRRTGNDEE